MRTYANILVILALVSALASPACQFVSGRGFLEICGADGLLKKIAAPIGFEDPISAPKPDHETKDKCPFCFTHAHMKSVAAAVFNLSVFFLLIFSIVVAFLERRLARQELSPLSPRAPPLCA